MGLDTQDRMPAKEGDSRTDDTLRTILEVLAAERKAERDSRTRLAQVSDGIKTYLPLLLSVGSVLVAICAWIILGVSPLESAHQVSARKEHVRYQVDLAKSHIKLGNSFLNVQQMQAAKEEFTRAKILDPYNLGAELGLMKVSVFEPSAKGQYDPEIADRRLRTVLDAHPNDTHILAFLGNVYSTIDHARALDYYNKAIASDETNAYAYFGSALMLQLSNKPEAALLLYEEAARKSPWNQIFLNNIAYQYYLRGNYGKAAGRYALLLSLDARIFLSYCMLANSELMLGNAQSAYIYLTALEALKTDGVSAQLARNQGAWLFQGRGNEILELYTPEQKNLYPKYLMALSAYLLHRDLDVKRHLAQIRASTLTDKAVLLRIIDLDLARLAQARPDLENRLPAFKSKMDRG